MHQPRAGFRRAAVALTLTSSLAVITGVVIASPAHHESLQAMHRAQVVSKQQQTARTIAASPTPVGIDVSNYQHPHGHAINWPRVARHGVQFTYVKATQATDYVNPWFRSDWAKSGRAGVIHGAYDFAEPQRKLSSAKAQARYFAREIDPVSGAASLPPALDLEVSNGLRPHRLIEWAGRWIHTMKRITGRLPIVYSYPDFWRKAMAGTRKFRAERLWGACFCSEPTTFSGAWPAWTFWQSTGTARFAGIRGDVDLDRFAMDSTDLSSLATGVQTSPPGKSSPPIKPLPGIKTTEAAINAPRHVTPGQSFTVTGTLTSSVSSTQRAPLARQRLEFLRRSNAESPWRQVATVITDADGVATITEQSVLGGQYQVRFAGNSDYEKSTSPVAVVSASVVGVGLDSRHTS